ncbi:MAG: hypothetical protein LBG83_02195 [Oscillospiraceae bacterium]|jgi:hypothetical protein|nr:hypothetical protein [Oscillospiraceae bacterium]
MITATLIRQLKQSNISKDGTKTGSRVQKVWKSATAEQKAAVCELSGSAKATIYRIFKTGGISAKLALALGKVLRIDPLYLTGEVDEPGEYSETDATELLVRLGYNKLLVEQEKAQRRAQREAAKLQKAEEEAAAAPAEGAAAPAEEKIPAREAPANEIVTNEDILILLQSLEIRAKAGIPAARELLRQIKLLLLA